MMGGHARGTKRIGASTAVNPGACHRSRLAPVVLGAAEPKRKLQIRNPSGEPSHTSALRPSGFHVKSETDSGI